MFAITRLRLLAIIIVVAAFAIFSSTAAANHSWGDYHWARTSNPFTLHLGDNVSGAWDSYLRTASSDWSRSTVLDTSVVDPGGANPRNCRPTSGRVEVCNARYGNNGWLGLAQIWVSGEHITQGVGKLNDTYFNTATYNTPAWRNLVMCQEVGHTLGLDHQDENFDNPNLGTCMDYTRNPAGPPSNEHPNQHDYDQLTTIYRHLDSTTTVGSRSAASRMPPQANQGDFNTPAEWGQLVRRSPDGRLEKYDRDFGNGRRLFTFVIRADTRPSEARPSEGRPQSS